MSALVLIAAAFPLAGYNEQLALVENAVPNVAVTIPLVAGPDPVRIVNVPSLSLYPDAGVIVPPLPAPVPRTNVGTPPGLHDGENAVPYPVDCKQ